MATKIILKKSSVTGRIPDQSTLDYGELALNYTDGVLYYKNSGNVVQSISAGLDSDLVTQLVDSSYASISTSLIPSTDSTYDLGTADKKWRELYLSGNTIHLGDAKLSADASGNIEVRDNLGQLKKIVVDEIEVGTGANKVKLKGNNGKLRVDNTSDAQQKLDFGLNTTSDLTEGTRLYYTDTRVSNLVNSNYVQARQIRGADSSWVTAQIDNLIDAAPGALDTLNELAAAIGDDADFSTTVTNLIAAMPDSAYVASYVSSQLPRYGTDYVDSAWVIAQSYITDYTVSESDVTGHQAALSITESQISDFGTYATTSSLATVATTGRYSSLTGTPTKVSTFTNDAGYITNVSAVDSAYVQIRQIAQDFSYSSLTGAPTNVSDFSNDAGYITGITFANVTSKPTTIAGYGITDAFDGAYSSLTGKPTIPTNNNQLTNGAGYTTNTGTVTSVGLSVPTGLSIANSPITTSGSLDITFDAGYSIPTTSKQAQWNSAYGWGNHANAGYLTSETLTSLSISTNTLTYTDEAGSTTNIDLSLYLDDTNLARITGGSVDADGLATFTRDDSTTFTVDFSVLFDDTNLTRITSAGFNTSTGLLTLTRSDSTTVTVDLDNRYELASAAFDGAYSSLTGAPTTVSTFTNDAGYLTSGTVKTTIDSDYIKSVSQNELYYSTTKRLETTAEGVTITGGLVVDSAHFNDNAKLNFGYGDDLQIYHNGNNSLIRDVGAGDLIVTTSKIRIMNHTWNENMITATQNDAVSLFFDGHEKLSTASTGITIAGKIEADSASFENLTVNGILIADGSNLTNLPASGLDSSAVAAFIDSDYILSRSTSVELYDAYDSLLSRHQLRLKADAQNGHLVLVGQILVEDSQGANPTLRDVSFHSSLEESKLSISDLKSIVASSTDFADFQARIAAL